MTRKSGRGLAVTVLCTLFLAGAAHAQPAISVTGPTGDTTLVNLAELTRHTVVTADRGLRTTFEGVALRDVLAKVGVPLGEALRGKALSRVIIASAPDGYQVTYAIAEIDAAFTGQIVLVADTRDGRPLLPDTGPLQIIVPNDKRPARWVRQVSKLEVRDVK
ncbi:MAG: molybdopterin-dependent oxidoreductase [Acidobacteriota bacterium]|nr:molybdopterin-dependent oxidoreductase [Acidobacteriota bacterium]